MDFFYQPLKSEGGKILPEGYGRLQDFINGYSIDKVDEGSVRQDMNKYVERHHATCVELQRIKKQLRPWYVKARERWFPPKQDTGY